MSDWVELPPIEIVTVEDTSDGGAMRLRVRVALSPEDVDAVVKVAEAVLEQVESGHDVIWMLFYYTAEAAAAGLPAELRALYVRHDARREYRPQPLMTLHAMVEIPTAHGLLMVELPWYPDA